MTIVKICGITNLEDALAAMELGADLLGLNFYPRSPRFVSVEAAAQIVDGIKTVATKTSIAAPKLVGLFVNESPARIKEILAAANLDYAQLHGDEAPEVLAELGTGAFRAIRPTDHADALLQAEKFYRTDNIAVGTNHEEPVAGARHSPLATRNWQFSTQAFSDTSKHLCPRLLIDAYDPNAYGGTGKKADWHTAATIAAQYPYLLLAGGLTPENVADAVAIVRPWGVDVSSGVEIAPGKKDHTRMKRFVQNAKGR